MRPFWNYYGGKWRAAPSYPPPTCGTIIEPFAGAAGYATRYPDLKVILVERFDKIAELWRYLIGVTKTEIRRIPLVQHVYDLPSWVPDGGRSLVGFYMNAAAARPCLQTSSGILKLRSSGHDKNAGWTRANRERVAMQVDSIRHWKIIEGHYTAAPQKRATWFVDAPYDNAVGARYVHSDIDYTALAQWVRTRFGQIIVCENEGATWLPFRPHRTLKAGLNGGGVGSKEVIWTAEDGR